MFDPVILYMQTNVNNANSSAETKTLKTIQMATR